VLLLVWDEHEGSLFFVVFLESFSSSGIFVSRQFPTGWAGRGCRPALIVSPATLAGSFFKGNGIECDGNFNCTLICHRPDAPHPMDVNARADLAFFKYG